jgi:hypothetical protein
MVVVRFASAPEQAHDVRLFDRCGLIAVTTFATFPSWQRAALERFSLQPTACIKSLPRSGGRRPARAQAIDRMVHPRAEEILVAERRPAFDVADM